jgi:hypothetical protein
MIMISNTFLKLIYLAEAYLNISLSLAKVDLEKYGKSN